MEKKMIIGQIGIIRKYFIQGWGKYADSNEPVTVELYINSKLIDTALSNLYRANLSKVHPTGECGFFFDISQQPLKDGDVVAVKVSKHTNYLSNSNNVYNAKKCFIHIGMHKTGSTSIQHNLYIQRNNLNVTYLDLGVANHSVPIFSIFCNKPENYNVNKIKGYDKHQINQYNLEMRHKLNQQMQSAKYKTIIISGEDIIGLSKVELNKLADYLHKYVDEIEIVAYVRPIGSYMSSFFQELVKHGRATFNFAFFAPNYRMKFAKFFNVFGQENVRLFNFEPNLFYDNDIVQDFCNKVGITLDTNKIVRTNDSMSLEALSLLYVYYKFGPSYGAGVENIRENAILKKKLSTIGSKKVKFCNKFIKQFIDLNSDDLIWIKNNIGVSMDDTHGKDYEYCISCEEDLFDITKKNAEELFQFIDDKKILINFDKNNLEEIASILDYIRKHK